jgi:hypothetical protein
LLRIKPFIILFAGLAATGSSLLAILYFTPLSTVDELMGFILFILIACLLIVGYALAIITLAFVGFFVLARFWK